MKRFARWAVVVVLLLGVLAGLGAWWFRGNADRIAREAIEKYGSAMTGARVTVDRVDIRVAEGAATVHGLTVGNPPGFRTSHAVKVSSFGLALDWKTIADPVIRVREISIQAPDVIYEKGDTQTNFDAIQANVARASGKKESGRGDGPKLIVERFSIVNARAQASAAFMDGNTVSVPLPDITLRNIGAAKGGVTPAELGQVIAEAMKQRLTSAISFDRLREAGGKLLEGAGKALNRTGEAIRGVFK